MESAYEECLSYEFQRSELHFERQKPLPIVYKMISLDCGYRLDLVVAGKVIVELKSVETLLPIHTAQILTYLKLSGLKVGLLVNFNSLNVSQNINRFVL